MLPNESCTQLLRAGNTNKVSNARYRGRIAKSEQTRNGLLAVLADHSTDGQKGVRSGREGGEPMSKEPTVGKVKPGITFLW